MDTYALTSALLQLINTFYIKYHGSSLTILPIHYAMGSGIVFVLFYTVSLLNLQAYINYY